MKDFDELEEFEKFDPEKFEFEFEEFDDSEFEFEDFEKFDSDEFELDDFDEFEELIRGVFSIQSQSKHSPVPPRALGEKASNKNASTS